MSPRWLLILSHIIIFSAATREWTYQITADAIGIGVTCWYITDFLVTKQRISWSPWWISLYLKYIKLIPCCLFVFVIVSSSWLMIYAPTQYIPWCLYFEIFEHNYARTVIFTSSMSPLNTIEFPGTSIAIAWASKYGRWIYGS